MGEEASDSMIRAQRCKFRAAGLWGARGTCYGRGCSSQAKELVIILSDPLESLSKGVTWSDSTF